MASYREPRQTEGVRAQQPTVIVVDDDAAVLEASATALKRAGFPVQAYSSAESLLAGLRGQQTSRIGCFIFDVRLGATDGCELLERVRDSGIDAPAILFSGFADIPVAVRALRAGAVDFIEKPVEPGRLESAVTQAMALPRNAPIRLPVQMAALVGRLTRRERDVLDLMLRGYANKEIAIELGISPRTVEIHRARVFTKTQTRHLAELIAILLGRSRAAPAH